MPHGARRGLRTSPGNRSVTFGQEPVGGSQPLDGLTNADLIAASVEEPSRFDAVFRRHYSTYLSFGQVVDSNTQTPN